MHQMRRAAVRGRDGGDGVVVHAEPLVTGSGDERAVDLDAGEGQVA